MATVDKTGTGALLGQYSHTGAAKVFVLSNIVDLTKISNAPDGEVYQALAIPADTQVLVVKVEILTPSTATTYAMDIGDGGSTAGWDSAINMKAAAGTFTTSVAGTDARHVANNQGYFYDSADSIDALIEASTTQDGYGPKFRVSALCASFN